MGRYARFFVVVLTAWHLGRATPARATTCQDVCPGSGDCLITTNRTVDPGSELDCSGRNLTLASPLGSLEVRDGFFTLRAHNVTLQAGRHMTATLTGAWVPFGIALKLTGTLDATGFLRANSNQGGGTIQVEAAGDIFVRDGPQEVKGIRALGETADDPGGSVRLVSGGAVHIDDEILAENQGITGEGAGGGITIEADGDIVITALLSVHGRGEGGAITLTSDGTISVTGTVKANGGGTQGNGGWIYLNANQIALNGPILAGTIGGQGEGGEVVLEAHTLGLSLNGDIDVTGGADGGGTITARSTGNVSVGAGVTLTSRADLNGGSGGAIDLTAEGQLTVTQGAMLDASGHTAGPIDGDGASVRLSACNLAVASAVTLKARGYDGGTVTLVGRKSLAVHGTVDATGTAMPGAIELAYRGTCSNIPTRACETNADCTVGCSTGACSQPDTTGATFTPAPPELVNDRNLVACS